MKQRVLSLAVLGAFTLASAAAVAAPIKMTKAQMDQVVAGTDYCYPPPTITRGDNGWGNGADGTNPGSGAGATAASKLSGVNLPPGQNKINTNPTTSTGR